MKPWSVTIQMKAIEQYCHVVLFIMLYKVVLSFESMDETLECDLWSERHCSACWGAGVWFYKTKFGISSLNLLIARESCLTLNDRLLEILHALGLALRRSFYINYCTNNHYIKFRHGCVTQVPFFMNCSLTGLDSLRVVFLMLCDDLPSTASCSYDSWLSDIDSSTLYLILECT